MKKVKNLTENKGLINTFRKLKNRTHLNKNNFKNLSFYLFKYNKLILLRNFKKTKFKLIFLKKFFLNKTNLKHNLFSLDNKTFIAVTLMFIN